MMFIPDFAAHMPAPYPELHLEGLRARARTLVLCCCPTPM